MADNEDNQAGRDACCENDCAEANCARRAVKGVPDGPPFIPRDLPRLTTKAYTHLEEPPA